jgi:hypothetical protein
MTDGDKNQNENLTFYYSRERRLERASESVRRLNSQGHQRPPNFFRTLTSTRASAFLLLAILMLVLTFGVITFLGMFQNRVLFLGNSVELSALRFKGSTYTVIKKTVKSQKPYVGPVDLAIRGTSPSGGPISVQRIVFSNDKAEEFRLALGGEWETLVVILQAQGSKATLQCKSP